MVSFFHINLQDALSMVDLVMVHHKEHVNMGCYVMEMEPAEYLEVVSTCIPPLEILALVYPL